MSNTNAQEMKLSAADSLDPTLPKELRVADTTLRRRRQAAVHAGHVNDFNPAVIGSGDPDAVRNVVDTDVTVGVEDLGLPKEMQRNFKSFVGTEWEADGLWDSEFRSQIARPLSASAYTGGRKLRMEAECVGVALGAADVTTEQRVAQHMFGCVSPRCCAFLCLFLCVSVSCYARVTSR